MKSKCWLLVRNRLLAQTGINVIRFDKDKHKRSGKIAVMISLIIVFAILALYCGGYAYGLCAIGIGSLVPVYAFVICSVIVLLFSMFSANGELFAYKDFDMLMSLPVKTSTVIASRFLNIYIWSTLFSALVMLPMGIVYAIFQQPAWWFWPMWVVGIFITCFIPTTIAVIFGAVITAIASKFKRSGMVTSVMILLLTCGLLVGSFAFTGGNMAAPDGSLNTAYFQQLLPSIGEMLFKIYPPSRLFSLGVVDGNLLSFLLLAGISIAWYFLFIKLLSIWYKKINTGVSTYHSASNFEMHSLTQAGALSALYKKELRRWAGSSVYLTNTIVGGILAVLMSGALAIFGTAAVIEALQEPLAAAVISKAGPFAIAAWIGMCCTTGSAISLEGKSLWIIQSLPVSAKKVLDSKLLVNLTISVPCSLISSALFIYAVKPGLLGGLVYFLVPLAFCIVIAVFGLWVNLKMPNYEWESETQVVKQSLCSMLTLLPGLLVGAALGVFVCTTELDYRFVGLLASIVLLLISWFIYNALKQTKRI